MIEADDKKEKSRLRSKKYRKMKAFRQSVEEAENRAGNSDRCKSPGRSTDSEDIYDSDESSSSETLMSDVKLDDSKMKNLCKEDIESSEYSSDSEDDFQEFPEFSCPPEYEQLREFGLRISQKDLDILLGILRPRLLPMLPKSAKTFLRTVDAQYNIIEMEDGKGKKGQFVYFGIRQGLESCINPDLHPDKKIELQINADGIPLKGSSFDQFWPLTAKVHFDPNVYEVFAIAIFCGQAKPKNCEDYLELLVEEINDLLLNGITIKGVHFTFKIKCFICDTPARAFLKNTLGHCGFEACERCEVVGEKVEGRTVFTSLDKTERTDNSFRTCKQPKHHHGPSPLQNILPPIDLIAIFVLDFLHLFCLGIMKKLLEYWLSGGLNVKLRVASRLKLGERMEQLSNQIPAEFQRKTRSTTSISKWKGTELRFFLLYCGPIVLKNLLKPDLYDHFLLLHVAARILCSKSLCTQYNAHAKVYLRSFFKALKDFYGAGSQVLNSHHLIHVSDDVTNMQCNLSLINAFEFESFLGKLKKKLRTPNRPLAQVCRRLHEINVIKSKNKVVLPTDFEVLATDCDNNVTKIRFKENIITSNSPDNMLLLNDGKIVSVDKIFYVHKEIMLECRIWEKSKALYAYPTSSAKLDIWVLKTEPLKGSLIVEISAINNKLVKLKLSVRDSGPEELFVIPFLH